MNLLALNAVDALAISLLAVMVCTLIAVGSLLYIVINNTRKAQAEKSLFEGLEEVFELDSKPQSKNAQPTTQPWEKDADWWKEL